MEPDLVDAVAVEVSGDRGVAGVPEGEPVVGLSQAAFVGAELVDDVEARLVRAIERQRVTPVAVEVAGDRHIGGVAEEEADVGDALGVRVAQIRESIGLAIEPGCVDAVAVPIAHERRVAGIAVVEPLHRAVGITEPPVPLVGVDEPDAVFDVVRRGGCRQCGDRRDGGEDEERRGNPAPSVARGQTEHGSAGGGLGGPAHCMESAKKGRIFNPRCGVGCQRRAARPANRRSTYARGRSRETLGTSGRSRIRGGRRSR